MNRKRITQFSIRAVLILTCIGAFVSRRFRPREIRAELAVESVDTTEQTAVFELTNLSPNDVWFYGYSVDSPFYSIECRKGDGRWDPLGLGWCGTGAGMQCLGDGDTTEFIVHWFDSNADEIRISLQLSDDHEDETSYEAIYSDVIDVRPVSQVVLAK